MIELTQAELEAVEVKVAETRRQFLEKLSEDRELSRLWAELHELEGMAIDARRARREAEILENDFDLSDDAPIPFSLCENREAAQ